MAAAAAADSPIAVQALHTSPEAATVDAVTAGSLDQRFSPTKNGRPQGGGDTFWLKLDSAEPLGADGIPVVVMDSGPTPAGYPGMTPWFASVTKRRQ